MSQNQKTENELHYQSLIELLKYGVTLITSLLTAIALIVGFLTWDNGKDMRDDLKQAREDMEKKITEMKKNVEDQKKELQDKQKELDEAVRIASGKIDLDLEKLRKDAVKQIDNVKGESISIARSESKNKIEEVFKSSNIEKFITDVAKEKLEPKINKVVEDQISAYGKKSDSQQAEIQKIQESYSLGQPSGAQMAYIDSMSKQSEYKYVRDLAKKILGKFNTDYAPSIEAQIKRVGIEKVIKDYFDNNGVKKYDLKNEKDLINILYKYIYSDEAAPFSIMTNFYLMERLLQKKIKPLDYEGLNKVYQQYSKNPYPLKW